MSILREFVEFCEARADEPVDYPSIYDCALARFGQWREGDPSITAGSHGYGAPCEEMTDVLDRVDDHAVLVDAATLGEVAAALRLAHPELAREAA